MIRLSTDYPQYLIGVKEGNEAAVSAEYIDCERGKITTDGTRFFAEMDDHKDHGLHLSLINIEGPGRGGVRRNDGQPLAYCISVNKADALFNVMRPKPAA